MVWLVQDAAGDTPLWGDTPEEFDLQQALGVSALIWAGSEMER